MLPPIYASINPIKIAIAELCILPRVIFAETKFAKRDIIPTTKNAVTRLFFVRSSTAI